MIKVKPIPPKIKYFLFIWPYDVENSVFRMKYTGNAIIRNQNNNYGAKYYN